MPRFFKSRPLVAIAAAAGLFAFAAPSFAAEGKKVNVKVVQKNGQTLYCMKQAAATGSLVPRTMCQTKDEWKTDGVVLGDAQSDTQNGTLAANPQPVARN